MLQGEHSAKLSTFIKLPFVINIFVLSIFEWPLKTVFTVIKNVKASGQYSVHNSITLLVIFLKCLSFKDTLSGSGGKDLLNAHLNPLLPMNIACSVASLLSNNNSNLLILKDTNSMRLTHGDWQSSPKFNRQFLNLNASTELVPQVINRIPVQPNVEHQRCFVEFFILR